MPTFEDLQAMFGQGAQQQPAPSDPALSFLRKILQPGQNGSDQPQPDQSSVAAAQPSLPPLIANLQPQQPQSDPTMDQLQDFHPGQGAQPTTFAGRHPKAASLLSIIRNGLAGAAAGRAASEQALAESGGRRSGGVGVGFQAGMMAPFQRQLMQMQMQGQMLGLQKTASEIGKNQAEFGKFTAETAGLPIKQQLEQAQAEAAYYKDDPNLGLIDLRTGQPVNPSGFAPLSPEEAAAILKQPGERVPLKIKNQASEIAARGWTTLNTADGVYMYNRITREKIRMGDNPREISLDQPVGALDNQTHQRTFATKAQINANPGRYTPLSADLDLVGMKQNVKDFASTKPGTAGGTAISLNTAIGHLGMLADSSDALGNKRIPLFNQLAQKYAKETGSAAPTNFDTIKNAVNAEVAKVFKGGVPADAEIQEQARILSTASSPEQLNGAIKTLVGLMGSRLNALQDHYRSVMGEEKDDLISAESKQTLQRLQSRTAGGGITVTDPTGGVHTFPDQASADAFKKAAKIQ